MPGVRATVFLVLGALTAMFLVDWAITLRGRPGLARPTLLQLAVGFITNFFDTLGIGSYAPTTALFRYFKLVPDERIPGTLNVGHTPPTMVEAFVFILIVHVDMVTLAVMVTAAACGAWFGAGVVASWPRRKIQIGLGLALLIAGVAFLMTNLNLFPAGGEAIGLAGWRLGLAAACSVALGALMTLGIGLYAPCMILISLLGMNPRMAFPIMMGSCAFLMPVASLRFLARQSYSLRPALGLSLGGVPAVLLAAFVVKSLPLVELRWLVVAVVAHAGIGMLRSAARDRQPTPPPCFSLRSDGTPTR